MTHNSVPAAIILVFSLVFKRFFNAATRLLVTVWCRETGHNQSNTFRCSMKKESNWAFNPESAQGPKVRSKRSRSLFSLLGQLTCETGQPQSASYRLAIRQSSIANQAFRFLLVFINPNPAKTGLVFRVSQSCSATNSQISMVAHHMQPNSKTLSGSIANLFKPFSEKPVARSFSNIN